MSVPNFKELAEKAATECFSIDDLELLLKQCYNKGYSAGQSNGYIEGYDAGRDEHVDHSR